MRINEAENHLIDVYVRKNPRTFRVKVVDIKNPETLTE